MNINTEKLVAGQTAIWICRAEQWLDRKDELFADLSEQEQMRALRFSLLEHKDRFVIFHGFMRRVLAAYLETRVSELRFTSGIKGKPYLDNPDTDTLPLQFNLTHTQDIALLAVNLQQEVGIDIEYKKRSADWQGIARRFCTQTEQAALFSLSSTTQQQAAFFDLWTRKEACMKVLGSGLSLPPAQFSMTVAPQKPALIAYHSDKFKTETEPGFKTLKLPEDLSGYCATLAVLGTIGNYQLMEL